MLRGAARTSVRGGHALPEGHSGRKRALKNKGHISGIFDTIKSKSIIFEKKTV